jgi:asparagine synthase (glutamine-hydrolysing)
MCGIAGIIQPAAALGMEQLKRMTDAIAHRGPDGDYFWQNKEHTALLGHRRLSIIDLSEAAAQPMHLYSSPSTGKGLEERYTIIHNGEIYNYIEIRKQLEKEGYAFRTHSDTEVILAAYDHWDDECVQYFDGMFAFVIWDEEEQELFAARDRFGEKPFFYHLENGRLCFASEMKALWALGIPRTANLKMLFNFITIGYVDNPARPEETFFENIFKLPPASRLYYTLPEKELTVEKYWTLDADKENKTIKEEDAIGEFQALLTASVSRRLRSDVPVGTSLSGGLDSSSIASIIHQVKTGNKGYECYTASFPGFEKDELAFSQRVSSRFGLNQHVVEVRVNDLVDGWSRFLHHQEEPVASASAFAQFKVFELARKNNTTVLLDGQGADETLAGYSKYYKWYWQELFQKRQLMRSGEIAAARKNGVRDSFGFKNVVASLFPDLASVILERQYLFHALEQEDLSKDFIRLQSREAYYTTPALRNLNGVLYFNTFDHGLEELLRYADRNSMAHGREVRLPFLDHNLVEFIFSLPAHFKIHEGWTKWILRKSMAAALPEEITWRKEKTGFEPPQKQWMEDSGFADLIMEGRKKLVREKILNPHVLDKPLTASNAYDPEAYDWRYVAAAALL